MKKEAFWAEQYRRHIGKMVGACYRYVADWDLAEDLAQDAFLAAMEKASTFRAFGSFEGWLKKIAINQALMHLRNCPEMVEWDENLHSQEVEDATEDQTVLQKDFSQEELLDTIGKLPVNSEPSSTSMRWSTIRTRKSPKRSAFPSPTPKCCSPAQERSCSNG